MFMHAARVAPEKAVFRPALPTCLVPGISEMQMKMTYSEQLRHPNWQRKRLEMLQAANFECSNCGDKETTLHVHHKQYLKGHMAWEYNEHQLEVLCEQCHELAHDFSEDLKLILSLTDPIEALAILRGYYFNADWFDPWIGDNGRDWLPNTHALGMAARFMTELSPVDLEKVVEFAVSMTKEKSTARALYPNWRGTFKELP